MVVLGFAQRVTPMERQGRVSAAVTFALFGLQAPVQALVCAAYLAARGRHHEEVANPAATGWTGIRVPGAREGFDNL